MMKMNKNTKIVAALLVVLMVVAFTTPVFATKDLVDTVGQGKESQFKTSATNISKSIFSIVQVVGSAVAIIMLVVLAIKYLAAAPSDKAEIKKHAVVYVVGAIVLFGASNIVGMLAQFATENVQ